MNTVLCVCWEEGWIRENKPARAIYIGSCIFKAGLKTIVFILGEESELVI